MANEEVWTAENQADYDRARGDYEALKATKGRVEARNAASLKEVAVEVVDDFVSAFADEPTAPIKSINPENLVGALIQNAADLRAALLPYDKAATATAKAKAAK